ncbi:MAG: hypothetical protein R2733_12890 [Acidimicrobiales bacterium]
MSGQRMVVGVALSARTWRGSLQRHCRDHEADVAVVLLHDGNEALGGDVDVLVVDDDTSWLSVPFVQSARASGIAFVGIFDPDEADGFGRRQLQHVGIETVLACSVGSDELVETIRRQRRDPEIDRRFAGLLADAGIDGLEPDERHGVVAVGGPAGSGATEVAIALAAGWGSGRPLLVDVDETHPTLARRLGLGLHPHLLTAVDTHRREPLTFDGAASADLRDCLARAIDGERPTLPFDVIAGLVTRDDWSLVRPDDVVDLLEACARAWPAVIVRLGPSLEDLHRFVGRHELSRRSATTADQLVGVCDASATGLLRFVDWLVDALGLVGDRPVDIVLNRAPRSLSQRSQLVDQLRSVVGDRVGSIVCAPTDRRVERGCWDADVPAWGPFRRAIAELGVDDHEPQRRTLVPRWRRSASESDTAQSVHEPSPTPLPDTSAVGTANGEGARS